MTQLHVIAGSEIVESFELKDPITFVGRSQDNDIQIQNQTVSRKHLKIVKKGSKYFITDLKSRNGTFFDGNYLAPGTELEASEGVLIAIGMTLICLGEGCLEQTKPFLDSVGFTEGAGEQSGIFQVHKDKTVQKKMELLHQVSEVLKENLPINETMEKILNFIFDLLKIIDRAVFILVDPDTETILDVISRSNKPDDTGSLYCADVVRQVIEKKKPLVVSNVQTEEENEIIDAMRSLMIESVMCVPLISSSQIMGVIYVDSQERPFGFAKEDLSLFVNLCQQTAQAIENARLVLMSSDGKQPSF